jgi:hypothetical protein
MKNLKIETVEDLVTLIQVMAWAFVVFVIMLVFGGTVFSMLYSVIFVSQPIKSMAPIDAAFTKMLNDIVLLLTGSISTIAGMFAINKGSRSLANKLAPTILPQYPMGCPPQNQYGYTQQPMVSSSFGYQQTPSFDNSWTPPPPPTNPPHYLEPDEDRAAIAAARESTRGE